jgi:hypothetical protein
VSERKVSLLTRPAFNGPEERPEELLFSFLTVFVEDRDRPEIIYFRAPDRLSVFPYEKKAKPKYRTTYHTSHVRLRQEWPETQFCPLRLSPSLTCEKAGIPPRLSLF